MNSQGLSSRLGLALSAIALAMLTACGGGGGEESASADAVAQPAAVPTVCGVEPTVTTVAAGEEEVTQNSTATAEINGLEVSIYLLTSSTGYPYDITPLAMTLPMPDLRDVAQHGYTPHETTNAMGVETASRLAPGSVGCVAGVSRIINNGTSNLLSWSSEQLTNLPVHLLPDNAINGFEFIHNFASTSATAVFSISKSQLGDANTARICHFNGSSSVVCSVPTISATEQDWTFRLPITASGIYMLAAPSEDLT